MIVVDDLNDWNDLLQKDAPIRLPNLQRLASRGTLFSHAYCLSPACNPSRAGTLTGLRPTTTGVYGNRSDWRKAVPNRPTIMQRFQTAGYTVHGAGKIFHHHLEGAFHDESSFDDFQPMKAQSYPPNKLNHAPNYGSRNTDWGPWPASSQDTIDHATVDYCIGQLQQPPDQPLFLACGIYKPHSPFFAPPEFHHADRSIPLPHRPADDWTDLPEGAHRLLKSKRWFWDGMMELDQRRPGAYQSFLQSYAACAEFADHQIGRLLDAVPNSPRGRKMMIVLWSDHGFHLGEKNHIEKFALWEKTNRIPLIIVAPGITAPNSICPTPVDLTVLYPTLLELTGQPADRSCDGLSIMPLLRDVDADWDTPALMTYGRGNHAVRSKDFRYIRYADGNEELYDHRQDPLEHNNLAGPQTEIILADHRRWLPTEEAAPVADLKR
ncbi:MAG: sulfatase [Fuerstiella sp.]